jgi:hypothetical protein
MSSDDFKITVKSYLDLSKKIEEAEKTIKVLKKKKQYLYDSVLKYMVVNKVQQLNLPDNEKLKTSFTNQRQGINKKWIQQRTELWCEQKNVDHMDLLDFIYKPEHRPTTQKEVLKKIKSRQKKSKNTDV